jgi:hypothetical protein
MLYFPGDQFEIFVPRPMWDPGTTKTKGGFLSPAVTAKLFLTSNALRSVHPQMRAKITRAWRYAAKQSLRDSYPTGIRFNRLHVTSTFIKPFHNRYDAANLYPTSKACVDGFVDGGLLPDDDNRYLVGPDPRAGEPSPGNPGVLFTFTVLPEE